MCYVGVGVWGADDERREYNSTGALNTSRGTQTLTLETRGESNENKNMEAIGNMGKAPNGHGH